MLKVGDKVWIFDENHRVYARDEKGKSFGGPIYSEHFRLTEITGETSRSWLIGFRQDKVSKKNPVGIYTDEQKSDKIWANDHRYKIYDLVRCCSSEQLKQIAQVLGYDPR